MANLNMLAYILDSSGVPTGALEYSLVLKTSCRDQWNNNLLK